MTTTGRYGRIADGIAVAATSTAVRDRREALGTVLEALSDRCAAAGVDVAWVQESVIGRRSHRVAITNPRTGGRIVERSTQLVEAADRALDRLSREVW